MRARTTAYPFFLRARALTHAHPCPHISYPWPGTLALPQLNSSSDRFARARICIPRSHTIWLLAYALGFRCAVSSLLLFLQLTTCVVSSALRPREVRRRATRGRDNLCSLVVVDQSGETPTGVLLRHEASRPWPTQHHGRLWPWKDARHGPRTQYRSRAQHDDGPVLAASGRGAQL